MKMRLCPEADRRQVRLNRILPEKSVVFMTETRIPPELSECQPARRLTKSRPWSKSRTVKWRRPALDRPPLKALRSPTAHRKSEKQTRSAALNRRASSGSGLEAIPTPPEAPSPIPRAAPPHGSTMDQRIFSTQYHRHVFMALDSQSGTIQG